jgi:hypothetical protein
MRRREFIATSCRPPAGSESTGTSHVKLMPNGHKWSLAPTVEQFVTAFLPAADPSLASSHVRFRGQSRHQELESSQQLMTQSGHIER